MSWSRWQVVNWSWLYIIFIAITLFHEEAPIREGGHHFIGNYGEEAPFYWLFQRGGTILLVNLGGGWWSFLYLCPKLCWRLARQSKWLTWCIMLWSPLYLNNLYFLIIDTRTVGTNKSNPLKLNVYNDYAWGTSLKLSFFSFMRKFFGCSRNKVWEFLHYIVNYTMGVLAW